MQDMLKAMSKSGHLSMRRIKEHKLCFHEYQAFKKKQYHKLFKGKPLQSDMRKDSSRFAYSGHDNVEINIQALRIYRQALGQNLRRNLQPLDMGLERQPANPDSRTQTPHVNISEMAKNKQIFLLSDLQKRSSWIVSQEEEEEEEEEQQQIKPIVPSKVSTQNMINKAIQTQSLRALGQFVPMPDLNNRERKRDELLILGSSSRDLELQNKRLEIQIKKKIQFHIKVNQGREERIGRNNLNNSGKQEIQNNQSQTKQQYCQMIQTEKEESALEVFNKHMRENLDKENEIKTLENEKNEQIRTLRKDYIDSNPTLQIDRANPQSPRLPNYIEQAIALEVDERLPLPNQIFQAPQFKVHLLEQEGHSAMDSSNARSPHHIMWRGRAPDASSKKTGQFALSQFRKLLLEWEHLFSSQRNIIERRDQMLSSTGMGGKTARFAQTWDLIKAQQVKSIELFLIFRDSINETRLAASFRPYPFKGIPKKNKVYKEIFQTEQEERIIEMTLGEQMKSWNLTFIVPKLDRIWRQILNAIILNEKILPLHLQMQEIKDIKMIILPMDWLNKLDLKSTFHHFTVYEPHRPYLAFDVQGICYRYKGMPFGIQYSQIFFTEATNRILAEVRITQDLRKINYSVDILLLYQDQMILKQQIIRLMEIFEQFGLTISLKKYKLELKQKIVFLGWSQNLTTMELQIPNYNRSTNIDLLKNLLKTTLGNHLTRFKYLTAIIGTLSFLRTQFKQTSIYLMLLFSADA
ncbi:MAG: hypothetical protein EZS28_002144 [Streblomastix strix]|uniref:Reverse transcriptase domain-containing protein n=1 Tax=Streblomastix strix TaxID=222440 RepID=A0A5J4X519_9EUKA|nr:MAG: hypothetical protein EZS28_002144 [Streblomastix strix]